MKFAHIADVHLGARPDEESAWSNIREKEVYDTFISFIDYLCLNPVDFLFIAGDLFDHVPEESELYTIDKLFLKLNNTNIIYVTGEADYLKKDSPLWTYRFMSNFYLLNGDDFNRAGKSGELEGKRTEYADKIIDCIHFEKYNLDIYGICQFNSENSRNDFESISIRHPENINVLLVHAGGENVEPFEWEDVGNLKKFDYVAMGHKHNFVDKKEYKCYYPGSLEPLGKDETGEHGFIKGYVDKNLMSAKLVPFSQREYEDVEIAVDENTLNSKLVNQIILICAENPKNIYNIRLVRSNKCFEDFDLSEVKNKYKVISVSGEKGVVINPKLLMLHNDDNELGANIRRIEESKSLYKDEAEDIYCLKMVSALWGVENLKLVMMAADKRAAEYAHRYVVNNIKDEIEYIREQTGKLLEKKEDIKNKLVKYTDHTGDINTTNEKIRALNLKISDIEFKDKYVDGAYERKRLNIILWCICPVLICALLYTIVTFFPAVMFGVERKIYKVIIISIVAAIIIAYIVYTLYNITQKNKKIKKHSEYKNRIDIIEKEREKLILKLSEYEIDNEKHKHFIDEEIKINEKLDDIEKKYKIYSLILA
ncbi:MAG: metallophosphoesterase [Lachnospiraceae bacterium]|nr:metallophosphoesterase [Lachnospiraceae bacterium]